VTELEEDTGRAYLLRLGPALQEARKLRYHRPEFFDDVTLEELEEATSRLRALIYSIDQGARLLERVAHLRKEPAPCQDGPSPATSSPAPSPSSS
jgi:hypothetical protein